MISFLTAANQGNPVSPLLNPDLPLPQHHCITLNAVSVLFEQTISGSNTGKKYPPRNQHHNHHPEDQKRT